MDNFLNLGISKEILFNLKSLNLVKPTPVQQRAIVPGFEGKDILAIANTGTGKTAAFGIPIIQRLNQNKSLSALILSPTRELSIQIGKHLRELMGKNINIKSAVVIGGDSMKKQIELIKKKPRIIIGTPGRIYDHINRKTLNLKSINILVLDETDRMLDLGFIQQIQKIINFLPSKKQTLLFSATLPKNIRNISTKYLFNPVNISVEKKEKILQNINHITLNINQGEKYNKLLQELDTREGSVIVFMKTKHSSKKIYLKLLKDGQSVNTIHGNIRQNKRINILNKFRNQKFRVLVATDIAARGLDIPHIEHVINYDLPQRTEDYIHRIGRTARAGKKGSALSFISENDKKIWKMISKLINPNIEDKEIFRKKSKTPKSKNKIIKFKKNGSVSFKKKKNRKNKSKDFTKKKVH
ncbi:MAG: ATP-dependent RNA helicase [alpha proteobacterium MED-G10]|nr:MAG: ATP-dependent RNA helicase [alpha proteobacterium MED-G10]